MSERSHRGATSCCLYIYIYIYIYILYLLPGTSCGRRRTVRWCAPTPATTDCGLNSGRRTSASSNSCGTYVTFENNSRVSLQNAIRERERNVLFNDTLHTFYLWLYGIRHMVKDHSDSERRNPLPPHGLFFPISSKGFL